MSVITSLKQYFNNVRVIGKTFAGAYTFTWEDRFLYFWYAESPGHKKRSVYPETGTVSSFIVLNIRGSLYYWPSAFTLDGLVLYASGSICSCKI